MKILQELYLRSVWADYCQAGGWCRGSNHTKMRTTKQNNCKGGCQKKFFMEFVTWFVRILNYSQSFQEQVMAFSSVIILSEKEEKTEYSCTWIYLNIFPSIVCFIWCTVRYTVRQTLVPRNVTRSTKLRGAERAPELVLRSTEFRSPENLFFRVLSLCIVRGSRSMFKIF